MILFQMDIIFQHLSIACMYLTNLRIKKGAGLNISHGKSSKKLLHSVKENVRGFPSEFCLKP